MKKFFSNMAALCTRNHPPQHLRPIHESLRAFQKKHAARAHARKRCFDAGVAIVIPCFNHAKHLPDVFDSLLHQTYRPLEIVFVDDHATDNSNDLVRDFQKTVGPYFKISLLRTPKNMGQAATLNAGIQQTTSSIITILNDDDYLMHDAVEAAVAILKNNRDVFLFGAHCVSLPETTSIKNLPREKKLIRTLYHKFSCIPLKQYTPQDSINWTDANDINMTHSGTTFFKAAWEAAGGYYTDKKKRVVIYSDRDFQMRVSSLFPATVSPEAAFSFWRYGSSVDTGINS
jgi:glycosyltransferase involved in cell wall biosynthesis